MKHAHHIIKWGKIKPYFDKSYQFNTLDIETVNNKLFLFGYTENDQHYIYVDDFYNRLHDFLITCIQTKHDILTWSRYDNTHLLKLILSKATKKEIRTVLLKVGKSTPLYSYKYKSFDFMIENIIKDSILFKVTDFNGVSRKVVIYNLKNLYDTDLETTAKNYNLDYYSKMGDEYHIINKKRFNRDLSYVKGVIESNRLDNIVLKDIDYKMIS
jgi:hypothetical protein